MQGLKKALRPWNKGFKKGKTGSRAHPSKTTHVNTPSLFP